MSVPFLGEIRLFSFGFTPRGWAQCNGQWLPINQNQALFALLGTTYGGNGQTTFALPDLRNRVPIHFDSYPHPLGLAAGQEAGYLTIAKLPPHQHEVLASASPGPDDRPAGFPAAGGPYGGSDPLATMAPTMVPQVGGGQPFSLVQPYRVVSFCIALQGIFPTQY